MPWMLTLGRSLLYIWLVSNPTWCWSPGTRAANLEPKLLMNYIHSASKEEYIFIRSDPNICWDVTACPGLEKRGPLCMRRCLAARLLHPAQVSTYPTDYSYYCVIAPTSTSFPASAPTSAQCHALCWCGAGWARVALARPQEDLRRTQATMEEAARAEWLQSLVSTADFIVW